MDSRNDAGVMSMYEDDIEEIVVESDEDVQEVTPFEKNYSNIIKKEREFVRRKTIAELYLILQKTLGVGENHTNGWVLKKAISVCHQLNSEDRKLKVESEKLLQQNYRLKKRLKQLQNTKKRKTGSVKSFRSSTEIKSDVPDISITERNSESRNETTTLQTYNKDLTTNNNDRNDTITSEPTRPKRIERNLSDLTEEDIEFCKIEDRIEDMFYEVKRFEIDVDKDIKNYTEEDKTPTLLGNNNSKDRVYIKSISLLNILEKRCLSKSNKNPIQGIDSTETCQENIKTDSKEIIKIANMSKLLDPVQNPIIDQSGVFMNVLRNKKMKISGNVILDSKTSSTLSNSKSKNNSMEIQQTVDKNTSLIKKSEDTEVIAISDSDNEAETSDIVYLD